MTTLIRLTIQEAIRRRFFIGVLLVSLLFIGIMYLPHSFERRGRLRRNPERPAIVLPVETQVQLMTHAGFIVINFFGPMLAIALSAGALSGEIEKGTLIPILSKPLTRWQIFLGRWCGIVTVLMFTIALWAGLLWLAVFLRDHQANTHVWRGAVMAMGYPMLFTTIGLFFSTFATTSFAMVLSLFAWGVGWQANTMRALGDVFDVDTLRLGGKIAGYLVPSQRLGVWVDQLTHWDPTFGFRAGNPVFLPPAPTTFDLVYLALYVVGLLAVGLWIFQRRDAI